ncbi:MAG: sulfite exporter TauE/SafE family protein [Promethearchaeota archaeon]
MAAEFLACVLCGMIGFGDALIFIPLVTSILGLQTAVIVSTIWGGLLNLFNFIHYRHFLDSSFIKTAILSGIPGTIIGTLLIIYAPVSLLEITLGFFITGFAVYKLIKIYQSIKNKSLNIEKQSFTMPILVIGGFSYGFFGGLIGTSGPINVTLLESTGHYRENFIGNFAVISLAMYVFKIPMYILGGIFPLSFWPILLIGIPIIFGGTKLGHLITPKIPETQFRIIVLLLLAIIGFRMIVFSIIHLI